MIPESAIGKNLAPLDCIGLFLNQADITTAYLSLFSANDVEKMLDDLVKVKPFKKLSALVADAHYGDRIAWKPSGRERVPGLSQKMDFYKEGFSVTKVFLAGYFQMMVSRGAVIFGASKINDDRANRNLEAALDGPFAAYYSRAARSFNGFNGWDFDRFKESVEKEGLVESVQEKGRASAFALYLLGHDDLRINFLSLMFSEKDPERLRWKVVLPDTSLPDRMKRALSEMDTAINEDSEAGARILKVLDLERDALYQPKPELLALMRKAMVPAVHERRQSAIAAEDHKRVLEGLSSKLTDANRRLEECRQDRGALEKRIIEQDARIAEILSRPPEFYRDAAFTDLEGKYAGLQERYKELASQDAHCSAQLAKLRTQYEGTKAKNANFSDIIEDKQDRIRVFEGAVSRLQAEMERLKIVPALRERYGNQLCLLITAHNSEVPKYMSVLSAIFCVAEVRLEDKFELGDLKASDVVILAADGTAHATRSRIESERRKVIVYPDTPNQLLQFLYDRTITSGDK